MRVSRNTVVHATAPEFWKFYVVSRLLSIIHLLSIPLLPLLLLLLLLLLLHPNLPTTC